MSIYLNNRRDLFLLRSITSPVKALKKIFFLMVYLIFCVLSVLPAFMYMLCACGVQKKVSNVLGLKVYGWYECLLEIEPKSSSIVTNTINH